MNRDDILSFLKSMACSQGFYGRLLRDLTEEDLDYLEKKNFNYPFDLVLFLECE